MVYRCSEIASFPWSSPAELGKLSLVLMAPSFVWYFLKTSATHRDNTYICRVSYDLDSGNRVLIARCSPDVGRGMSVAQYLFSRYVLRDGAGERNTN